MNRIEQHLYGQGVLHDLDIDIDGDVHHRQDLLRCIRTWTREPDDDIPWVVHEMGRKLPCCWHGTRFDHPRFRMVERAQLLWCGWFAPLITHPRPVQFDCAPLYMDQIYYEFFLGFVRPSDYLGVMPVRYKCDICERFIPKDSGRCDACTREGHYRYDEDLCPYCDELPCICDADEDGETDDYDDEEWEAA
jgi:hypothetical protein